MNNYEMAAVFKVAADEQKNAAIEKVKGFITKNGGSVSEVKEIGKRDLAYEIEKTKEGFYCYIQFTADAQAIKPIDAICRIEESLLRYIIIKK